MSSRQELSPVLRRGVNLVGVLSFLLPVSCSEVPVTPAVVSSECEAIPRPAVSGQYAAPPALPRALITKEDVDASIESERALATNYGRSPSPGEPWFAVLNGTKPILITAPHATQQTRDGKPKDADRGTGSLAQALHRLTGATVIYTTHRSPSDPNYYDDNDFKKAVAEALERVKPLLVLDLHASHENRPYDIDFGTMNGKSLLGREHLLEELSSALRDEGLQNLSRDFFPAEKNATITKWVAARGVPCIQLEISSTYAHAPGSELHAHRYAQLLQGLVRFLRQRTQ